MVQEEALAQECTSICAMMDAMALPPLNIPDEKSKPHGSGTVSYNDLDFHQLVTMRIEHETRHARLGVRVRTANINSSASIQDLTEDANEDDTQVVPSTRRKIIQ